MSEGWLDPWGTQHEYLCEQYMADEAVMGKCTCNLIKKVRAQTLDLVQEKVMEMKVTYPDASNQQRAGQQEFNDLHARHPEIANKIRGTLDDPFYNDSKIPAFRLKVEELLSIEEAK